jgi:fructan beta-fructosidase
MKDKITNSLMLSIIGVICFFSSCSDDYSNDYYKDNNTYNDEPYRPSIHFTPEKYWMNDPNGMVYLDGEYHLFYQYNPYRSFWGNLSWGHAVSKNLINWEHLPTALFPDKSGDIFSGSAVIDKNNTAGFGENAMIAIYTSSGARQNQSLAYSLDKGRTFTKYEANPVLTDENIIDFRDPKVFWHKETNKWVMSLATSQTITFYGSKNLKEWEKLSEFGDGIGGHGGVWECPDLFPLTYNGQTKWVLLVSINPGAPNGGSGTQYFIGDFNGTAFKADNMSYPLWLDYGKDNYAGVTWNNIPESDGRRIFIGWMSNWQYAEAVPTMTWRNGATLPRTLTLKSHPDGYPVLTSEVVSELDEISEEWVPLSNSEEAYHLDVDNKAYQLEINMAIPASNTTILKLSNDAKEEFVITIDRDATEFRTDRTKSGKVNFSSNFPSINTAPLYVNSENITLTLIVDNNSIEAFINGGIVQQTNLIFPQKLYNAINISGTTSHSLKIKKFNSIY